MRKTKTEASPALGEPLGKESWKQHKALLKKLPEPLLAWYRQWGRSLPWRENQDPYRIWVSEIMLQQTRVEAVKESYVRFLEALPDLKSLAQADEEQLLKLWEGMGYYSRVRNMQKAAQVALKTWGRLPSSASELQSLPGIGEYTAGAVASIGFGKAVPAVDGNVLRVFSRYMASFADIGRPEVKKEIRQAVEFILPSECPGDFNQAIMDLGATVCIPKNPRCAECPLRSLCRGAGLGVEKEIPVKRASKSRPCEKKTVLLLVDPQGRLGLEKRPEKGLLAGMWQLPSLEGTVSGEEVKRWAAEQGIPPAREPEVLPEYSHVFSHVQWDLSGFFCPVYPSLEKGEPGGSLEWCTPEQLQKEKALPSAFRT